MQPIPAQGAELPERVFPVEPPDAAAVGPRPVFQIGYDAEKELDTRELRFRIELRPGDDDGEGYLYDQTARRKGWYAGDPGRVVFSPPRPIRDGSYTWTVGVWNGVDWVPGEQRFRLRIDSVPPADVEGLQLRWDPEREAMVLGWDPVTLDRDGGPEYVARYRVYRFVKRPFVLSRKQEVAVTVEPWLLLPDESESSAVTFYRVTAQDEAGNEYGRRRR